MRRRQFSRHGFVYIHKRPSLTSRAVLDELLKRIPGKAGLEGILDPFAQGLLIAAYGAATRLLSYLHLYPKEYEGEVVFGVDTDSGDPTGKVTGYGKTEHLDENLIRKTIPCFLGEQEQKPPRFSNVKIGGKRAHVLSRSQQMVDLRPRRIFVHELQLSRTTEKDVWTIYAKVSKGTYLRALVRDFAQALGTVGHLRRLIRTAIGPVKLSDARFVEEIDEKNLLPADAPFMSWPALELSQEEYLQLLKGGKIKRPSASGMVRLYTGGVFVGLGRGQGNEVYPERLPQF
ncbi:MAG: tRNA pseudouridine(55) synthase TruB [Leptospiraceae bacterium]|nr:tRNA pseudouridine(55) synthase TruB [Leptospiraceae bacterium]MDW8307547.1 tRNA pseudouridine(55) synthase TruB [Leptospiraceae bacterium]